MRISDWSSDVCSSDLSIGKLVFLAKDDGRTDDGCGGAGSKHGGFAFALAAAIGGGTLRIGADSRNMNEAVGTRGNGLLCDVGGPLNMNFVEVAFQYAHQDYADVRALNRAPDDCGDWNGLVSGKS